MASGIHHKALFAIAALLFIAAFPLPYGFYTFLKIVVCLAAGYLAYQGYITRTPGIWPWLWSVVAVVFNPIVAITMSKEVWALVDIITGAIFSFVAFRGYKQRRTET
jgi:hypothetical protein